MILGKSNIRLINITEKIGDSLMFSALPENYYRTYGKKIISTQDHWAFKYNPFIDTQSMAEFDVNPHLFVEKETEGQPFFSIIDKISQAFKANIYCRTPRLYQFEDYRFKKRKQVTLHLDGLTFPVPIPRRVLDQICRNYPDYAINLIGSSFSWFNYSKGFNFVNRTGISKWDSIEVIAESEIFIGVNSGFLHAANCYDHVRKKALVHNDISELRVFRPSENTSCAGGVWLDYGLEYFSFYDYDIGVTKSYLKI